jgi:murein DD-endopeptidase MepM/ murein hydrolase activator NlpD
VGAPIRVAASGTIISQGWAGGFGLTIVVNHHNGIKSIYAHLSKILVEKGEKVSKGQLVGLAGSTGLSTGPHLHYELKYKRKPISPMKFLNLDIFHLAAVKRRYLK